MRLVLTERFQQDFSQLDERARGKALEALFAIPAAFREPSRHAGIGLRKLHPSGVWEIRIGLDLRLLLLLQPDTAIVRQVATHDEVKRYLRSL